MRHNFDFGTERAIVGDELVLPESWDAQVHRHDLLLEPPLPAEAHLFHRIDTELSDAEWQVG